MTLSWLDRVPSLPEDPAHPMQVALRTYALSLALSLGPSLFPFLTPLITGQQTSCSNIKSLRRVLRRELGHDGFAFAITLSIGGGATLRQLLNKLAQPLAASTDVPATAPASTAARGIQKLPNHEPRVTPTTSQRWEPIMSHMRKWMKVVELSPEQQTFFANIVASSVGIFLLQAGRERAARSTGAQSLKFKKGTGDQISPTLDLTLLLVVRALDVVLQSLIHTHPGEKQKETGKLRVTRRLHSAVEPRLVKDLLEKEQNNRRRALKDTSTTRVDAFLFWACSARIMWCFFYEPQRLPRSYVKWINTLANADPRLLHVLKLLRQGKWTYANCHPDYKDYLKPYATDLGFATPWADPSILPAYGGTIAQAVWERLGVTSRPNVGGLPCELVHGDVGASLGLSHSCLANTGLRGVKAWMEAIAIYLPVHFLPVVMTRPQTLLRPHRVLQTLLGAVRSATFLSSFVASCWFAVCFTRSLVLAKYLPFISHDFWDGPSGCMLAGSLLCGSSIWIENGKRRGEMALYVMPKALRTCLPDSWGKVGHRRWRIIECIAIILSISTLLTAGVHRPNTLRGLSRWTLSFIINGPNAGFWKRKRRDPSIPPTPSFPPTSVNQTPYNGPSRSHTPNIRNYTTDPNNDTIR